MELEIISVGPFEVNCAIVWNSEKQTLVIDPGHAAADIEEVLKSNGLTVSAYLLTHGHADHLCALAELHAARPAPVYIHAEDEKWAFSQQNQIFPYYPVPIKPAAEFIHPETIRNRMIAGFSIQTLETPGHTRGGVCYYFEKEKVIFTGDTLFKGTCGRTDLPGGDGRVLMQSLKKLAALPDDVTAYPGHNENTTIGYEKKTNFFMQQAAR
jgi:glyoxylase-like metal-dependent hydrolase (beta-lactamase superfamily II)